MLQFMIPEETEVANYARFLSGKSESDLRKQSKELRAGLQKIEEDCRILDDNGNEVGFDWMKTDALNGATASDREAEALRMTAERRAIRNQLDYVVMRERAKREIESNDPVLGNAYGDMHQTGETQLEDFGKPTMASYEAKAAETMFQLAKAVSTGSGPISSQTVSLAPALEDYLRANQRIKFDGLNVGNLVKSAFGTISGLQLAPQAATLVEKDSTSAGFHPYPYQDTRVALMSREIIAYSGVIQRRSTGNVHDFQYLQEDAQTLNAGNTTENPAADFPESDFTVNKKTDTMRKIASLMTFTTEQMGSVDNLIFFVTTRLIRAVANKLESDLINGNNNGGNPKSEEIRGLTNFEAGTNQASTTFGYDEIHKRIMDMEDVEGQTASVILMRGDNIHQIKTLHVGSADGRYIMGGPDTKGPNVLWDIPVLKVPKLPANTVFVIDPAPIVFYDDGRAMTITFDPNYKFARDVWAAKTSIWGQQVFTKHVPTSGNLAKKYIQRINNFKADNS